jgi:hypothetical protein
MIFSILFSDMSLYESLVISDIHTEEQQRLEFDGTAELVKSVDF